MRGEINVPPKATVPLLVKSSDPAAMERLGRHGDLGAETARLKREIGKVRADIDRADKKLGNEKFLAKAPADVVDEQRDRRAEAVAARDKLNVALRRLAGPPPTKRPIPQRIPKTP